MPVAEMVKAPLPSVEAARFRAWVPLFSTMSLAPLLLRLTAPEKLLPALPSAIAPAPASRVAAPAVMVLAPAASLMPVACTVSTPVPVLIDPVLLPTPRVKAPPPMPVSTSARPPLVAIAALAVLPTVTTQLTRAAHDALLT